MIQRTTYENGFEIDSETISPAKVQRVERSPSRVESGYLRSPQRASNTKSHYHLETRAEERSSPFRYSPVRREASSYKLSNQPEYFGNQDREVFHSASKITEVEPEAETSGRIVSKHSSHHSDSLRRERDQEIVSHRPYTRPQNRTVVNTHTYGYTPEIIQEEVEIRHEPAEQETFTQKVYASTSQGIDSKLERYSPSRSRLEAFAPRQEQRGNDITIEKTTITIKGGNNQSSTERERLLLSDKVRKQIEESKALVDDLLESNRRNTHKLKDTINHIEIEYQTPSKKLPLGARERSTADTLAGRYAH